MRPGCWPFKPGLTAGDALTQSGGADRFGEVHRVLLVRRGQPPCLLDLAAPPDTYTPLQPGDILMVDDLKPWEP